MKKYDIAIIGAGCSGLSLAYRLSNTNLNICILESGNLHNRIRKTWSYWDVYGHPFKKLENNSLNNINCISEGESTNLNCERFNYKSIDSKSFDKHIFDTIESCNNIDIFFDTNINSTKPIDKFIEINSDNEVYNVSEVYDSRPDRMNASMYQVFLGYYISTQGSNNTISPKLMDFTDDDDFSFYYVLPCNDNVILVEYTFFTPTIHKADALKDKLEAYIHNRVASKYNLIRSEYGVIPMTSIMPKIDPIKNIYKIGIRSGATRASTGYTFLNIQKQSDYYADKIKGLKASNALLSIKSRLLRKMDNVLLKIIMDQPKTAKRIIFRMFALNNDKTIIKFLSDIPSLFDILRIVANMPKLIFIKYAIKSFISKKI